MQKKYVESKPRYDVNVLCNRVPKPNPGSSAGGSAPSSSGTGQHVHIPNRNSCLSEKSAADKV